MESLTRQLTDLCAQAGAYAWGTLPVDRLVFDSTVRQLCRDNACGEYGKTWACPPGVGTEADCEAACRRYRSALVFSVVGHQEDPFDLESLGEARERLAAVLEAVRRPLQERGIDHLAMAGGGCRLCPSCTYPQPCRHPDQVVPSVSSYCLQMTKVAARAGLKYQNGPGTATFFGVVLYDRAE